MHSRAHIRLDKTIDVTNFVSILNSDGSVDKYMLENFDETHHVSARSFLGAMYMSTEFNDEIYLVNLTEDGKFPFEINQFRA